MAEEEEEEEDAPCSPGTPEADDPWSLDPLIADLELADELADARAEVRQWPWEMDGWHDVGYDEGVAVAVASTSSAMPSKAAPHPVRWVGEEEGGEEELGKVRMTGLALGLAMRGGERGRQKCSNLHVAGQMAWTFRIVHRWRRRKKKRGAMAMIDIHQPTAMPAGGKS